MPRTAGQRPPRPVQEGRGSRRSADRSRTRGVHVEAGTADHGRLVKWINGVVPVKQAGRESALSAYQQALRDRLLAAPVVPAPEPWRPVFEYQYGVPVGGLLGIGFATHP